MTRKVSKFEKERRANLDETIVKRGNSKPKPIFPMNEKELAIFHKLSKTESLYRYELYSKVIIGLDIEDEWVDRLEGR